MSAIVARYPADCEDCGGGIEVGDLITQRDGEWVHASACTASQRAETVCPRCFMTACDCGRDT